MSKTIGIISGKGGVGKTTLAINIAATLHALEEDTLLVDANISNPHVGIMLGNYSTRECIHDVLTQHTSAMQSIHYHSTGLKIVPGSMSPSYEGGLDMSALGAYSSFAKHVLFDSPPGDHSHVLATANEVVVITTTDQASLLDARRSIEQAEEAGTSVIGVIVNKYRGKKNADAKQAALEGFLGYPIIGFIADDDKFLEAAEMQVPYCWLNPKSPATQTFKEIATRIVGIPNEKI